MATRAEKKPARPGKSRGRSYGGLSPEQRRAQRRAQLVSAARAVFGEQGVHASTVRQICRAAGLTERYFYESFDSLQALFNAAYDESLDELRSKLTLAIAQTAGDVEAMARAGLQAYYRYFREDRHAARILLIEVYGNTRDMERLYKRGVQDFAEIIRAIIEARFGLPAGSRLDAGLLATSLVGAAIQLAIRWYVEDFQRSEDEMVENSLAIITAVSDKLNDASTDQAS